MFKFILVFIVLFINLSSVLSQVGIENSWQYAKLGKNLGLSGIITSDIDNDGIIEIIFTGDHNTGSDVEKTAITILEFSEFSQSYELSLISNIINEKITAIQVFDINSDGNNEIYLGTDNGTVKVYDPILLDEITTFSVSYDGDDLPWWLTPSSIDFISYDDINNDQVMDLIISNEDTTFIYDSEYVLIDKIPYGAGSIEIGNVDNDEYKEVVFSNGPIIQIVGSDLVEEYDVSSFYNLDFRSNIAIGDLNFDNIDDLIFGSGDSLYVFDFSNDQLIWSKLIESQQASQDFYIGNIWLSDYSNDNVLDIYISNLYFGDGIYCYNGVDGSIETYIYKPEMLNITDISFANIDDDSNVEMVWSTGAGFSASESIHVYDLSEAVEEWKSPQYEGNFQAFNFGEIGDNAESLKLVAGVSGSFGNDREYEFLSVFDAVSKEMIWQNTESLTGIEKIASVSFGDVNNDDSNELLIGVEDVIASTRVYALNSNYDIIKEYPVSGMTRIQDVRVLDIDDDNINELVITTGTNVLASTNPDVYNNYIYIYDSESANLEWRSERISGIASKTLMLNIGSIDNDNSLKLLAINKKFVGGNSLVVVDLNSFEMIEDVSREYSALVLGDMNNDNIDEVIVGVENGFVEIIENNTLTTVRTIETPFDKINTISIYDFNGDGFNEIVVTDGYTISLFDGISFDVQWISDTINDEIAEDNSIKIGNIDTDDEIEILLNTGYGIFEYEIDYNNLPNYIGPLGSEDIACFSPNPVTEELSINLNGDCFGEIKIQVFDISGKIVFEDIRECLKDHELKINLSNLHVGTYTVCLFDRNDQYLASELLIKN